MAGTAARRAHNVVGDVRLVGAQPRLVIGGAAVGAARAVGLAQRAIQLGQLAQLHAPQIVVALGHFDALPDDVLDAVDGLFDALRIGGRDERVQRFVFARQRLAILAADFALFDAALAADDDLGAGVLFHGCGAMSGTFCIRKFNANKQRRRLTFQCVSARTDQQTDEIDVGMLLLRNQNLVADTYDRRPR